MDEITEFDGITTSFGLAAPGFSNKMSIGFVTDSFGNPTITHAESHDGLPILIESKECAKLLPIKGRGHEIFAVPTRHLGEPINRPDPVLIGQLGINYLENLLSVAENL